MPDFETFGVEAEDTEVARLRDAYEALLERVVAKASLIPVGTGHPYNTSAEHATWAMWGEWRAGGPTVGEARLALKKAIRADLAEATAESRNEATDG